MPWGTRGAGQLRSHNQSQSKGWQGGDRRGRQGDRAGLLGAQGRKELEEVKGLRDQGTGRPESAAVRGVAGQRGRR